jgi:subtilisin family serine protease
MNKLNSLWLISLPVILMACGGGGDLNSDNAPPPAPPTVASAEYVVVTGKEYTYQLDTTGTGLSFSIPTKPETGTASVTSDGLLTYRVDISSKLPFALVPLKVNVSNVSGTATATINFAITEPKEDPLFDYQWHLKNVGQDVFSSTKPSKEASSGKFADLNIWDLWGTGVETDKKITGKGVIVNVVDSGLEINHPDLAGNVSAGDSVNFGGGKNPTNTFSTKGDHGTSVAGLIAMVADNGIGGKGVAPDAKIMGHNYLGGSTQGAYQNATNIAMAFGGTPGSGAAKAHIFNASYGMPGCIFTTNSAENEAYAKVKILRSGKGGLIVKSAGNGFGNSEFCNDKLVPEISNANSAFDQANVVDNVIVVAAVNANGKKSSYSTTGANIWVSGIGGEYGFNASTLGIDLSDVDPNLVASAPLLQPAMITTDQSGCTKGYHTNKIKFENDETLYSANEFEKEDSQTRAKWNKDCNYTSTFNGTSSAAPTVSGVIALMLEANPNLTWRDVKHILAKTAKQVDGSKAEIKTTANQYVQGNQTVEQGWVVNKAGVKFHNWYGFGLVDAGAAVAEANKATYVLLPPEAAPESRSITGNLTPGTAVNFTTSNVTTVETAEISFNFATPNANELNYSNCLQYELKSPSGTKSILLSAGSGFLGGSNNQGRFLTNAFYGENAKGTWSFVVRNLCNGSPSVPVTSNPTLTIRGRQTP